MPPADTPALDALLKEVDALAPWQDASGSPFVPLAPRLAAMLRVAVEALREMGGENHTVTRAALAHIEAIAKGDA